MEDIWRVVRDMLADDGESIGLLKGRSPTEQFVEQHSNRVDIRLDRARFPSPSLGCRVVRGTDRREAASPGRAAFLFQQQSDAKVEEFDLPGLRQHDVFWFDVAMDHPVCMDVDQCCAYLYQDAQHLSLWQQGWCQFLHHDT